MLQHLENSYLKKRVGGKQKLRIHLRVHVWDCCRGLSAAESFADFVARVSKLGLKADYKYTSSNCGRLGVLHVRELILDRLQIMSALS